MAGLGCGKCEKYEGNGNQKTKVKLRKTHAFADTDDRKTPYFDGSGFDGSTGGI